MPFEMFNCARFACEQFLVTIIQECICCVMLRYDMEGYIPRTDPGPVIGGADYCDTPGGCERWNFDMNPPRDQFLDYYLAPFEAAIKNAAPVCG